MHQSQWRTILGVADFALVFIIGLCVLCCTKKKKKTASAVGSPGEISGQGVGMGGALPGM